MAVKKKGIDISAWQGNISKANFTKAKKAGVEFVILRLGYTSSGTKKPTIDTTFENNYKNAVAAGLPIGVYFYSLATTEAKAKEEANFCIKNLKGKVVTYPVFIDVEDPNYQSKCNKKTLATVSNMFCKTIKAKGYKAGVYASLSWLNNKIGTVDKDNIIWVAQYYDKCQYKKHYDMWQYSSTENVNGIAKHTDVSYCYTDFDEAPVIVTKDTYDGTFPSFKKYLEKGDIGTSVKNLQKFLNWAMDYVLVADGNFGPKTLLAVKAFQKKVSLKQTGIFGKEELEAAKKFEK